jgi:signal transduction histidine kinase
VSDNGVGMTSKDIQRALMPFEQIDSLHARRHEGAGLGLHLSANLMKVFGGELEISSEVDQGTTVTLHFPPERSLPRV